MGYLIIDLLVIAMYFLPTIVAYSRKVKNRQSIVIINFFLGWTLLGWVVALAMSARDAKTV